MPDLLYSDCYNWCIHYRTLFGNFKDGKRRRFLYCKRLFKGFRQNFKISTIIWLILLVIGALLAFDFRAANMLPAALQNVFRVLVGAFITFYILLFSYIFPYIARFENGIKDTIKNSVLIIS